MPDEMVYCEIDKVEIPILEAHNVVRDKWINLKYMDTYFTCPDC